MTIEEVRAGINPVDREIMKLSEKRWMSVGKPLFSLGKLETQITRISGIKRIVCYELKKKALIVMCADNGVVAEGVTQTGQEVTAIVADNFTRNETSTCLMAQVAGVDVFPIDIGMVSDVPSVTEKNYKIAYGTNNFAHEPAMTGEQLWKAIEVGIKIVRKKKQEGYDILLTGEMGIGNTTTSSAVASVLLEKAPEEMTGRGAGLDSQGLKRKIRVIKRAVEEHHLGREDVLDVMAKVGGYDIAGLCGLYLGGGLYQVPVVIDGFISAVAALCAVRLVPQVRDYMIPSHISKEPATKMVLEELGLSPLLTCDMCLGEGSGAVAVMPLLEMGLRVYNQMSTFEEINVEQYEVLE